MTPQEAVGFIEESAMLRIMGPIGEKAWQTLKSAVLAQQTNNTGSPKWPPCKTCGHPMFEHQWLYKSYNFCPECGRQLRASA